MWEDIGGVEEAKSQLLEAIELPVRFPEIYAKAPLRVKSGALVYGPPGTDTPKSKTVNKVKLGALAHYQPLIHQSFTSHSPPRQHQHVWNFVRVYMWPPNHVVMSFDIDTRVPGGFHTPRQALLVVAAFDVAT